MTVRQEILAIVTEECELEATPALSAPLADTGVDSMAIICAIHALEERFEIDIPLDIDITRFSTVGELVEIVERLAGDSARGGAGPSPAPR